MQATFEKVVTAQDASIRVFQRNDPAFDFHWHFHPEYELTFILRSRGRRFVGDNIADYADGDLVLLGANLPHTWASLPDGRPHHAIVIQFARDFLGEPFLQRPELRGIAGLLRHAQRGLQFPAKTRQHVAPSLRLLYRQRGLPRLLTLLRVLETLADSRDARTLSSAGFVPALQRGDQARIDRVCAHIREHLADRLALRDVATVARLSPRAFTRFFKRTLGKTLVEYINELRVGHACELLINTDQSVTDTAFASGFNNLAYFNRRFLALKKLSPRDYRRAHTRSCRLH